MARQMYKIKQEIADGVRLASAVGRVETLAVPLEIHSVRGAAVEKRGKYKGTVIRHVFMVPFRHCLGSSTQSVLGCVGKVRAIHIIGVVLSL
jgi:hypothetical protein